MLNVTEETWKPVKDFEGLYFVSSLGRVLSKRTIRKPTLINSGYLKVSLKKDGKEYPRTVHRLVAIAFLENPINCKKVNHINGIKTDNRVCNLEWVTPSQNKIHALTTGLKVYNCPTRGKRIGKTSKYRNVTYDKRRKKWRACIRVNKVNHYTKRFDTELEAAKHVNWIIDKMGLTDRPKNDV